MTGRFTTKRKVLSLDGSRCISGYIVGERDIKRTVIEQEMQFAGFK